MSDLIGTSPRTSIAAVSWADGDKTQVRVYTLDGHGGVRESAYDGTNWTFNKEPIARARNGSGLAALKHEDGIHVYYLAYDKPPREQPRIVVHEVYRDWREPLAGNWEAGSLNALKVKAEDFSGLAAVAYEDKYFAVFFLRFDGYIHQVRRDDSGVWKELEPFPHKASYSSSLAAVTPDPYGSAQIRVYFQKADRFLATFGVEESGSYQADGAEMNMQPSYSKIAAVLNEIYYLNTNFWFSEGSYYGSTWHCENHPDETRAEPGGGIAVTLDGSGLHRA